MGNLRNVRRAFEHHRQELLVTSDPSAIARAEKLVLPGVGAFGEAVRRIDRLGLREPLLRHIGDGKPLLGVCLGMQLLFEESEESPGAHGLGILKKKVLRFPRSVKVPHIGWNDVIAIAPSRLLGTARVPPRCFYFVHSYYAPVTDIAVATTTHGIEFASAVEREGVLGVQFHPEKSQEAGLDLINNFIRL